MLGISVKRTSPVAFAKPLSAYIAANYSKEEAANLSNTLQAIDNTRERVVQALNADSDPAAAAKLCEAYFKTLDTLSARFPFGRNQGSSFFKKNIQAVMMQFQWSDSFRPQKSNFSYNIEYEKAAILFNIGAYYSLAGIKEDRSLVTGLTAAFKHFQTASGVFAYLAVTPEYDSNLTIDLSGNAYRMISHMALAQAQACYFELAVMKKMSPSLCAKLAKGTAALFQHASAACQKPPLKQWLEKSKYDWARHFVYQNKCFSAAAHYWSARGYIANEQYGEEIAELYVAKDRCAEAERYEGNVVHGLKESRRRLYEMTVQRLAEAVKDNDTIYYQTIPRAEELREIEQKFVVKATPYSPPAADLQNNPFARLVPLQVHEDAQNFQSQLNAIGSEMKRECQEAEDHAKVHLSSLNLPAALEALSPDEGFPSHVWERVREIQFKGGLLALEESIRTVQRKSEEGWASLKQIKEMLAKEADDDSAMRRQWGSQWHRSPSSQVTAAFRRDAETVEQYLTAANNSDKNIERELTSSRAALQQLALSKEQLEAKMPRPDGSGLTGAADELKQLLETLSHVLEERAVLLQNFEKKASDASQDIVAALMKNTGKPVETVFNSERKALEPIQRDIATLLDKQTEILDQITVTNEAFQRSQVKSQAVTDREAVIQAINVASDTYNKLEANVAEGSRFYSDIIKDYLHPLRQTVTDFVLARDQEKTLILQQVTSDLSKVSVSGDASYPAMKGPSAPSGYEPTPDAKAYSSPASNPNMQFGSSAPVYPQQQSMFSSYVQPQQRPQQPQVSQQPRPLGAIPSQWSCPACTFEQPATTVYCAMCNTENPNPTNPGTQQPNQANQVAADGKSNGWRTWFKK